MSAALRPLAFGEILDNAFTLFRRNFALLFGLALTAQLPVVLLWLVAPMLVGSDSAALATLNLVVLPYSLLAWMVFAGAVTHAAAQAYEGGRPTYGASLRHSFARLLPLLAVSIMAGLLMMVGFIFLIVPGVILMTMYFAVVPVVVLEEKGPAEAMGRSRDLSRGARMRILGALIVGWIITMLPTMAVSMIAGVGVGMSALSGTEPDVWFLSMVNAASALMGALTGPFIMLITMLLYFDRRARTEAPDLEAAVAGLSHSAL